MDTCDSLNKMQYYEKTGGRNCQWEGLEFNLLISYMCLVISPVNRTKHYLLQI